MVVKTIQWKNDRVVMLDQRLLPHKEVYRVCRDYNEVAEAIRNMVIRDRRGGGHGRRTGHARNAGEVVRS